MRSALSGVNVEALIASQREARAAATLPTAQPFRITEADGELSTTKTRGVPSPDKQDIGMRLELDAPTLSRQQDGSKSSVLLCGLQVLTGRLQLTVFRR